MTDTGTAGLVSKWKPTKRYHSMGLLDYAQRVFNIASYVPYWVGGFIMTHIYLVFVVLARPFVLSIVEIYIASQYLCSQFNLFATPIVNYIDLCHNQISSCANFSIQVNILHI